MLEAVIVATARNLAMIDTGVIVAARYGINREAQDQFSLQSQHRTDLARLCGGHNEEMVPGARTWT